MAAGIYNFTIEQGATFQRIFKYKNEDGTPKSLTSVDDIRMQIRETINSTSPIVTYDIDTNFTRSIPAGESVQNQFTLVIPADTTKDFTFSTAVYDIELQEGSTVTRLLQGKIKLSKEVTR